MLWGQVDIEFPWVGDKPGFRKFRRKNRIYTRKGQAPNLIIYYEPLRTDKEMDDIFFESMRAFREDGGAVLVINDEFCPRRCMNQAGLICGGKMLGIVENKEEDLKRLLSLGGVMNNA